MKAIGAVMLTGGLSAGEVAGAGIATGVQLLAMGTTGVLAWVARAVPRSAVIGLRLGLGLAMGWLGLKLIWDAPLTGNAALAVLVVLPRVAPRLPAAPLALVVAGLVVWMTGGTQPVWPAFALALPGLTVPGSWEEGWRGLWLGAIPQLPLTLANAVILTALLVRDLFPADQRVTEQRLAPSTGVANLVLGPIGAMPMCHGAGGLMAQHRFGARTGFAPALLGVLLLVLGLGYATDATALLALVPMGAVGALLLLAGGDLALSRRLVEARADCRPAIAATAFGTMLVNPAVGLAAGWIIELARRLLRPGRRAASEE